MPTGTPKIAFHKQCIDCNEMFDTFSNRAKFCFKCKKQRQLTKCDHCGNLFKEVERKRRHYCNDCKKIKFYCKCGCGKELLFKKGIKGQIFIHGHARTGSKNSEQQNMLISQALKGQKFSDERKQIMSDCRKNIPTWNKGLTKDTDIRLKCSDHRRAAIKKAAKECGFGKWMIGKSPTETTRKKLSDALKGHLTSNETRQKISKANSGENNGMYDRHHTVEAREKISDAAAIQINTIPPNYKRGYFYSEKNKKDLHYRSSWELQAYKIFEQMSNVISYEVEPFRIKYNDLVRGCRRNYVPDLLVTYDDGSKEIIEIKPGNFLKLPTNVLKFKAASQYADEHNMKFNVLTYKDLFIPKQGTI